MMRPICAHLVLHSTHYSHCTVLPVSKLTKPGSFSSRAEVLFPPGSQQISLASCKEQLNQPVLAHRKRDVDRCETRRYISCRHRT